MKIYVASQSDPLANNSSAQYSTRDRLRDTLKTAAQPSRARALKGAISRFHRHNCALGPFGIRNTHLQHCSIYTRMDILWHSGCHSSPRDDAREVALRGRGMAPRAPMTHLSATLKGIFVTFTHRGEAIDSRRNRARESLEASTRVRE